MADESKWNLEFGATTTDNGVHFRVWAPMANVVRVRIQPAVGTPVEKELHYIGAGIHFAEIAEAGPGDGILVRPRRQRLPDPYSRFQPQGIYGPSEVISPESFCWTDEDWSGTPKSNLSIYECHVGAYTPEGTFRALTRELAQIKEIGVDALEIMPVAEFPGTRNWGYDGVGLYAPSHNYGHPDDFRRLVNTAHEIGLAVILDCVYNHSGPEGNFLPRFSDSYFSRDTQTPWEADLISTVRIAQWSESF